MGYPSDHFNRVFPVGLSRPCETDELHPRHGPVFQAGRCAYRFPFCLAYLGIIEMSACKEIKQRPIPEKAIQKTILESLAWRKLWAYRLNSGGTRFQGKGKEYFVKFGFPGCPDIMVLLPSGRTLWIEVKSAKGALSQAQKDFKEKCDRLGVPHLVARSWDDVEAFLEVLKIP